MNAITAEIFSPSITNALAIEVQYKNTSGAWVPFDFTGKATFFFVYDEDRTLFVSGTDGDGVSVTGNWAQIQFDSTAEMSGERYDFHVTAVDSVNNTAAIVARGVLQNTVVYNQGDLFV